MRIRLVLCVLAFGLGVPSIANAHPMQFGVAEVTPSGDGYYRVHLRFSAEESSDPSMPLTLEPGCTLVDQEEARQDGIIRITSDRWRCTDGEPTHLGADALAGRTERILVRSFLDSERPRTGFLSSYQPSLNLHHSTAQNPALQVWYGVEHILEGWDHLLFVLGLFLLVSSRKLLILTVSAFTVGHSLTLAWATLGGPHPPAAPTEAVIALSVLLLAVELSASRSKPGQRNQSLTLQYPWLVAGACGLIHGFGFAGAILEFEVAPNLLAETLVLFSLGVEIGQVGFVLILLFVSWVFSSSSRRPLARRLSIYLMGCISAFWVIDRTVLLLS